MTSLQPTHNVELEAAKFLHKLIQESKDEPPKLATKLYVILQHMKSSGKEHSMPYQVISRAMETIINQHGLDIEALKSSHLPLTVGTQMGDSATAQHAESSQPVGVAKGTKVGVAENEISKAEPFASVRPTVGPSSAGQDCYPGSGTHSNIRSLDHESPSLDTRSANSQSQDRGVSLKDGKKSASKRKRSDPSSPLEPHIDNPQQHDAHSAIHNLRKGKTNKAESPGGFLVRGGENAIFSMAPGIGQLEASSSNVSAGQQQQQQQGGSFPAVHENLSSRGLWNQNAGLPLERCQRHTFSSNMTVEIPLQQSTGSSLAPSAFIKVHGGTSVTNSSYPSGRLGLPTSLPTGKALENDGEGSNMLTDVSKDGIQNSNLEMTTFRATPREMGKFPIVQDPTSSVMLFKEQQLKQLRAQCLVFLAFRNDLMPKKLHLEIALGNNIPEDGNAQSNEPSSTPEVAMPFGRLNNVVGTDQVSQGASSTARFVDGNSLLKDADELKIEGEKSGPPNLSSLADERKHLLPTGKLGTELQSQETGESQPFFHSALQQPDSESARCGFSFSNPVDDVASGHLQVGRAGHSSSLMSINKQVNCEASSWTGIGNQNEVPQASLPSTAIQHELLSDRKNNGPNQFQSLVNLGFSEQNVEDKPASTDTLSSPKHTMLEKWIVDQQRKKLLTEQKWFLKQQKTKQRIATCFDKLKETVSSSEDISAKTKSVIELKKLQLLELQHRLRSDFLNDFFKPITTEMDRLRSYKKHKHGRRIKQLEKFEQKMKEERQKRIRERQKDFFAEIEVHRERLDDVFKIKRERWKGFNKYVKEFHKRKERIHREKIDRIQREKINLLKINDVEGYLRMVQDAKSDRVKQLLKETEKYIQKLASKLQESKSMARHFENDRDDSQIATVVENNEAAVENDYESDQAKHYKESNEKYYLMAHSIKESITQQPACLLGGKLREYQMNGLRWLVSLYNNHLNGILADEMGLGKTIQVIALICYLMEAKNDKGPFLVVVPSSVLPGWESEINFWAPGVHKIVYSGPPEERRRLFKEKIIHQKFNVLLTTYEYLMNKHDRPKLSKLHWHYIIIDEGHRIKNASCKLNADLKHYQSSHRLLLTGTPLQNNLEELWALLNFLLPNIFSSSEDFSQWFNKPFESNGDNSAEAALLSEEENLLIINRLHQVLRPFVLRRLKHKVENELPEKIERLVRCEASAYQKLLMNRVEENLGSIGNSKVRSVHNSVMELRNICNHPYLSQLHAEEVDGLIPKHFLPPIVRLCGKLEMLDRLLPKLKVTNHRVLFFSTMTRLLDVMEEYLNMKQYRYLRLDGHTSGSDRGGLIELFNQPDSPYFIFLLSIRAGGVGVNLQAADTVIIFDTDWNPQVDLQAQARAHRIGQKRDVLVLRFETVQTVEEQVRAAAEHKLGVANQSITAGFFDNNTSAQDRREYLESLLRECKKEEAAPVLDDDGLNDVLARSESEIDVFESVDKQRREEEMVMWKKLLMGKGMDASEPLPPLPSRLVTDDDLKAFYEVMKVYDVPPKAGVVCNVGVKRKGKYLQGLDTQQYGRGKRAREVRSYEEKWTEEEFEKMCQVDSPDSPKLKEETIERNLPKDASRSVMAVCSSEPHAPTPLPPPVQSVEPLRLQQNKEVTPPSKRGRGRPRRATLDKPPAAVAIPPASGTGNMDGGLHKRIDSSSLKTSAPGCSPDSSTIGVMGDPVPQSGVGVASIPEPTTPSVSIMQGLQSAPVCSSVISKGRGRKVQSGVQAPRLRGRKEGPISPSPLGLAAPDPNTNEKSLNISGNSSIVAMSGVICGSSMVPSLNNILGSATVEGNSSATHHSGPLSGIVLGSQSAPSIPPTIQSSFPRSSVPVQIKGQGPNAQSASGTPQRRGRKQVPVSPTVPYVSAGQISNSNPVPESNSGVSSASKVTVMQSNHGNDDQELGDVNQEQASKVTGFSSGLFQSADVCDITSMTKEVSAENSSSKANVGGFQGDEGGVAPNVPFLNKTFIEVVQSQSSGNKASLVVDPRNESMPGSFPMEGVRKTLNQPVKVTSGAQPVSSYPSVVSASQSAAPEATELKRRGCKAPSQVEVPRLRGKKQVHISHAVDASIGQDPILNPQPQNKLRDSLGNKAISLRSKRESDPKELTNVMQGSSLQSGLVGQDPDIKENSGIQAFARIQTAVTDVARVMKEIFSETCSSKTKIGDTSRNEGRIAPVVSVKNKKPVDTATTQSSVDKIHSGMRTFKAAAPVVGTSIDNFKQAGYAVGVNMEEYNSPISPKNDASNHGSKTTDSFNKDVVDSRQVSSKNSIIENNVEVTFTVTVNAVENDIQLDSGETLDLPGQRPGPDDLTGPSTRASSNEVDLPVTSQGVEMPSVGNEKKLFSSEESHKPSSLDSSSLDSATVSMKTDDAGVCLNVASSFSGTKKPPENNPGNKMEASSKACPMFSPLGVGVEDTTISVKTDHVGYHSGISTSIPPIQDGLSTKTCIKIGGDGDLKESAPVSVSPSHSNSVGSPPVSQNTSGNELHSLPVPDAPGIGSLEDPTISRVSDTLGDNPSATGSVSRSQDHSGNVDFSGGFSDSSDLNSIGGPKVTKRANYLGGDLRQCDVEASFDQEKLEGLSTGGEDKSSPVLAGSPHFISSESADIELPQKVNGGVQHALAVKNSEIDHVDVCIIEVDPFEVDMPMKDSVATLSKTQDVLEDNGGMQLPPKAGSTEVGDHFEVCDMEGPTTSPKVTSSMSASIENNSTGIELQPGVESRGLQCADGCNMGGNLSEERASLANAFAAESANKEPSLEVHVEERVEKTNGDFDGVSNMQIDHTELQVDGIVMQNVMESTLPSSFPVTLGENIDSLYEKGLVGSSISLKEPQPSEAEMGDEEDASKDGVIVPKVPPTKVFLPSSSSTTGEEKNKGKSEQGLVGSSIGLRSEELKGSVAKMIDQIVVPSSSLAMEEEKVEGVEGLFENGLVSTSVVKEESNATKSNEMVVSESGGILSETTLRNTGLSSSSSVMQEENIDGSSERSPCGIPVALEEPRWSESENVDQMAVSLLGGGTEPKEILRSLGLASSSLAMEAAKVEGSIEKSHRSSVVLEETEGSKTRNTDQIVLSEVHGIVSEDSQAGCIGPQDTSLNMDLPSSSSTMHEGKIDVSSKKIPEESKIYGREMIDPTHSCGTMIQNNGLPSSSSVMQEENIEVSSERSPRSIPVALEEPRWSESENVDQMAASQLGGTEPKEILGSPCLASSSSLAVEAEKGEGSTENSHGISALLEETEVSKTENIDQIFVSQAHGMVAEDTQGGRTGPQGTSGNTDTASFSSTMQEGKIDSTPKKIPEESKWSEKEIIDQTHSCGTLIENLAENTSPSPATAEENINVSSEEGPVGNSAVSEDSKGSEAEVVDQVDHSESVGIVPENQSKDTDLPSSSLATEDEHTEAPSDNCPVGSLEALEKMQGPAAD